jgi:plasmid maintenance system antidote protein VapI
MKYPNIENERVRYGMKRGAVARMLGIQRDTYTAWISGEYPIPANFVLRLCMLFRCSADYLLAPNERGARWKHFHCLSDIERGILVPVMI